MPRYIDKDELVIWLNAVDGIIADGTVHPQTIYKQIITDIENFGSADVVEVVRCRDCRWFLPRHYPEGYDGNCEISGCEVCNGSFCSNGERKERI